MARTRFPRESSQDLRRFIANKLLEQYHNKADEERRQREQQVQQVREKERREKAYVKLIRAYLSGEDVGTLFDKVGCTKEEFSEIVAYIKSFWNVLE